MKNERLLDVDRVDGVGLELYTSGRISWYQTVALSATVRALKAGAKEEALLHIRDAWEGDRADVAMRALRRLFVGAHKSL